MVNRVQCAGLIPMTKYGLRKIIKLHTTHDVSHSGGPDIFKLVWIKRLDTLIVIAVGKVRWGGCFDPQLFRSQRTRSRRNPHVNKEVLTHKLDFGSPNSIRSPLRKVRTLMSWNILAILASVAF